MSETPHLPSDPRTETCPECQAVIFGFNGREFDRLWEQHKAEVHPLAPTPEELIAAQTKAKTAAAEVQTLYRNEEDHTNDLARHFEGVSRIERRLPQLLDFAFKLANQVGQWATQRDYSTKALQLGNIYWTPDGEVAAEFTYDRFAIISPQAPEYLKSGYVRLPQLQEAYPAVFELVMTMGHHLVNIMDNRRHSINPKDISFVNLHHFVNPNNQVDHWAFKIYNKRRVLKAGQSKI